VRDHGRRPDPLRLRPLPLREKGGARAWEDAERPWSRLVYGGDISFLLNGSIRCNAPSRGEGRAPPGLVARAILAAKRSR